MGFQPVRISGLPILTRCVSEGVSEGESLNGGGIKKLSRPRPQRHSPLLTLRVRSYANGKFLIDHSLSCELASVA